MAELNSNAKALVEIDLICDQYEQAYRHGELCDLDDEINGGGLNMWLDRVSAPWRAALQEELCSLLIELELEHLEKTEPRRAALTAITQCSTFDALSPAAKLALATRFTASKVLEGTTIIRGGESSNGLFLLTRGEASVMSVDTPERTRIDQAGAGSVFGEISMIMGLASSADVVAETEVELLHLSTQAFEQVRRTHPEVEVCLSQLTSDRLGSRSIDALCGKSLRGYRFHRCLGRGAMGVVYEVESEDNHEPLAIKMLRYRFLYDPRAVTRFDQEAELMRRLEHPHIVAIRDHFVEFRTRFIVMDLCDRRDLRQWLHQWGPLDEVSVRGIIGQIASALSHAHRQGVLHMDLKPANLLVDSAGMVRLTDFGLSRLLGLDDTEAVFAGTPAYMSPEQLAMSKVGPSSDWYSLACVAFELLTGRRLFEGDDRSALQKEKLRIPSLQWPCVAASESTKRFLEKSLHPDPGARTFDIDEIVAWAGPAGQLERQTQQRVATGSRG